MQNPNQECRGSVGCPLTQRRTAVVFPIAAVSKVRWRTHSCVPRRDSSRRQAAFARTAGRRQECRRGTQECVRHQDWLNPNSANSGVRRLFSAPGRSCREPLSCRSSLRLCIGTFHSRIGFAKDQIQISRRATENAEKNLRSFLAVFAPLREVLEVGQADASATKKQHHDQVSMACGWRERGADS